MKRLSRPVMLTFLALSAPLAAAANDLSISVGIGTSGPDSRGIDVPGFAMLIDSQGNPVGNASMSGFHGMHDINSGIRSEWTITGHIGTYDTTWLGFGTWGRCYQGHLELSANSPSGNATNSGYSANYYCAAEPPPPPDPPPPIVPVHGTPEHPEPLILDLDGDGIRLTGLRDSVNFDINGDGTKERVTWTSLGERDAWLCLDRNGNGRIDGGTELFGDATPWPNGQMVSGGHGFGVLAAYDSPQYGGNGDYQIDDQDAVYSALMAWTDVNHNGRSEAGEIESLANAGVRRIETDFTTIQRRDSHGNLFRYKGRAWRLDRRGTERPILAVDVYLLSVED